MLYCLCLKHYLELWNFLLGSLLSYFRTGLPQSKLHWVQSKILQKTAPAEDLSLIADQYMPLVLPAVEWFPAKSPKAVSVETPLENHSWLEGQQVIHGVSSADTSQLGKDPLSSPSDPHCMQKVLSWLPQGWDFQGDLGWYSYDIWQG